MGSCLWRPPSATMESCSTKSRLRFWKPRRSASAPRGCRQKNALASGGSDMIDNITAEIVRRYLETVSEEISKTMERTAVSQVFSEAHDYSTGVFYYDGKQVNLL